MKKILLLLFVAGLFFGCKFNEVPDDIYSFPLVNYSFMKNEAGFMIPENTTALQIFNCFYNEFGYGTFEINGIYSHTEVSTLNGNTYSDTINKNLIRLEVYNEINSNTPKEHISSFGVRFFTDKSEIINFTYQWQYHNTNVWNNNKLDGKIVITL